VAGRGLGKEVATPVGIRIRLALGASALAIALALAWTCPRAALAQEPAPPGDAAPGGPGGEGQPPPQPKGAYDSLPDDQKEVDPEVRKRAIQRVWLLRFEHGKPARVTLGREPSLENYWVLPFTLTNEDGEPHSGFFIDVYADSDKSVHYEDLASPLVKEKVRKLIGVKPGETFWGQEELTSGTQTIEPGQTVKCVVIFHGYHPEMDRLTITVRGLTNDVHFYKGDEERREAEKLGKRGDPPQDLPPHRRKVVERALLLKYYRPGDEFYATLDALEFEGREWVTLERIEKTDLD